jgi:nucleoside-diphosphate-sugar epimerase
MVLVTGATGFLGGSLVRRLLPGGARVRVLVRSPVRAKALANRGAEVVVGDVTDPAAVAAAVDGVAVVYHLAGRLLVPGVPSTEYRRTHVDGTKLLLARCREEPGFERFVHCSTTGVLGVTGNRPAGEDTPFCPTNVYEATKAEAELAVRDTCRDGFPAVIARPGLVYGPGDLHLLGFFRSVLRRQFRPIGRTNVLLHPIYIDDLTEGLLHCGRRDPAVGECFHLAGAEPASLTEMAEAIAAAAGIDPAQGYIPYPVAQAVAVIGDRLPAGLRSSAPLTRERLDFLTYSRVYDVSRARRLLNFTAATAFPAGVARTLAWYRRHGHLPDRPKIGSGRASSV